MKIERMIIPDQIRKNLTAMAARGEGVDAMIARMKQDGLPKVQSIRLLSDVAHIRLGEAKKKVHFSPVWEDRRESDDAFHETALRAFRAAEPSSEAEPVEHLKQSA